MKKETNSSTIKFKKGSTIVTPCRKKKSLEIKKTFS